MVQSADGARAGWQVGFKHSTTPTPAIAPLPAHRSGEPALSNAPMRLTPRSAVAIADTELLRVARTQPLPEDGADQPSLADRIRGLLTRLARTEGTA